MREMRRRGRQIRGGMVRRPRRRRSVGGHARVLDPRRDDGREFFRVVVHGDPAMAGWNWLSTTREIFSHLGICLVR